MADERDPVQDSELHDDLSQELNSGEVTDHNKLEGEDEQIHAKCESVEHDDQSSIASQGLEEDREHEIDESAAGSPLELPVEMEKFIKIIHHKSTETGAESTIYLVGTAHVSKDSCEHVEAAIRFIKPKAVFLELCRDRRVMVVEPKKLEVPSMKEMLESWKNKKMNAFGICYSYFLAKVAQKLEVLPGAEFKKAFDEGLACNAAIIFGDRPVHITLQRTWSRMTYWSRIKLAFHMLSNIFVLPSVEELNKMLAEMSDTDMLTVLIQEYSKHFPILMDTLLTERDLFMTYVLRDLVGKYPSIVAVVGKGHVSGILSNWDKPIEINSLLEIPEKKEWKIKWKMLATLSIALGIGIYLGHRHR